MAWLAPYRKLDGHVVRSINFRKQSAQDKIAAGLSVSWPTNVARHSFGSFWLAEFNDVNKLALEMGNSPAVIEKHYKRAVKVKNAERYWNLFPTAGGVSSKVVSISA